MHKHSDVFVSVPCCSPFKLGYEARSGGFKLIHGDTLSRSRGGLDCSSVVLAAGSPWDLGSFAETACCAGGHGTSGEALGEVALARHVSEFLHGCVAKPVMPPEEVMCRIGERRRCVIVH